MANRSLPKPARATAQPHATPDKAATPARSLAEIDAADNTSVRLLAYLASVEYLSGDPAPGIEEQRTRGRALIKRMADTASGTDQPSLRLSLTQCADLLRFVQDVEPTEPKTWWLDRNPASHVCGFMIVLEAIERCLRAGRQS